MANTRTHTTEQIHNSHYRSLDILILNTYIPLFVIKLKGRDLRHRQVVFKLTEKSDLGFLSPLRLSPLREGRNKFTSNTKTNCFSL